jgi:hypothetical protein
MKERYMKRFLYLSFVFIIYSVFESGFIFAAENQPQKILPQKIPDEQSDVEVVKLNVYPAPLPRPALKYRLLPGYADQTPGNAALLYYQVFQNIDYENGVRDGLSRNIKDEKESEKFWTASDKLSEWQETPLNELPKDEIHKLLDSVSPWWFEYVKLASCRMECNWGEPISYIDNPFDVILVQAQLSRNMARILVMKARLELAEGKPEEAIETLQMGLALSQNIGKGKVPLVNHLTGLAIAGMMRFQLLDLTQVKGSPNLYWSLNILPHPFLSYKESMETEEAAIEKLMPELREAKTGRHSPEQWQNIWETLVERYESYEKLIFFNKPITLDAKKLLTENYPKAKEYLIGNGRTREDVESMAPAQVILLYSADIWEEQQDDITTWMSVDYSQWPTGMRDGTNDITEKYKEREVIPFSRIASALSAVVRAQGRMERDFTSLRIIEALRLYAYNHEGKLPESLDDIKEVPIPQSNPLTGKPFPYHLEDDTAVLLSDGHISTNYEYRIKIAK